MPTALVDNELFVDFSDPVDYAGYDSEGNLLTKAQLTFFRNSKCLNENGHLYLVYHASNKDYQVFDKQLIGSGNGSIYGKGFYFSSVRSSITSYGNVIKEYYLNLKNPFIYEAIDYEYDVLYNVETFIEVLKQNNYPVTDELQKILEDDVLYNDGGLDTIIELTCGTERATRFFKNCGFDGIMNLDTLDFVAFEPNQIKLRNNVNPTIAASTVA